MSHQRLMKQRHFQLAQGCHQSILGHLISHRTSRSLPQTSFDCNKAFCFQKCLNSIWPPIRLDEVPTDKVANQAATSTTFCCREDPRTSVRPTDIPFRKQPETSICVDDENTGVLFMSSANHTKTAIVAEGRTLHWDVQGKEFATRGISQNLHNCWCQNRRVVLHRQVVGHAFHKLFQRVASPCSICLCTCSAKLESVGFKNLKLRE